MKKYLLLLNLFFAIQLLDAQQWDWAKSEGNGSWDDANSIAVDKAGNTYMAGRIGANGGQIILTKYDSAGNMIWTKIPGDGSAFGVTVDFAGYIYVTGYFSSSTIAFDSIILNKQSYGDIFLVKYDANGNVIWAKGAGGGGASPSSVTTDPRGNVYVCGTFYDSVLFFDSVSVSNLYSGVNQNRDLFLVKYDSNGNAIWAKSAGGNYYGAHPADANCVTTDRFGNIYLTGGFACSSITFGSQVLVLQNSNNILGDMFIVKFDNNGNPIWAKNSGTCDDAWGSSVAVDASENVYVVGGFDSPTLTFDSITLINPRGTCTWGFVYDADFIVKYNKNGNVCWAESLGSSYWDDANSIITDNYGNIYMTGTKSVSPSHSIDMFLARFDTNGNILMTLDAQGGGNAGNSIAADIAGNVYVAGDFWNPIVLNPYSLNNTGGREMFIAKLHVNITITTSVFEQGIKEITVFPNPSSGIFTIQMNNSQPGEKVTVRDVLGNCLLEKNCKGETSQEINLSNQPRGIYFVELLSGDERRTKKIIIQ